MKKLLTILLCSIVLWSNQILAQDAPEIEQVAIGQPGGATPGQVKLTGIILDQEADDPIVGANILISGASNTGVSTDVQGVFELSLQAGESRLTIDVLGYAQKIIDLSIYQDGALRIEMISSSIQLEQVTITDRSARDNIENVIAGVEQIGIEELKQMSRLLGEVDVLRSIQSLSGVTSTGDGASGFNVRGGNADENLILQDDALILNPSHTLGFFSLFHPDLVGEVNLYKGDQPAALGGRLSSVLDVKLREGDNEKFGVNGGVGLVTSRLTVEGPIKKNRSSFILGGRISYMDWVLNQVKNINVQRSKAFFYDFTAKADGRIGEKTKIGFTAFFSADEFNFADEVNFAYQTQTVTGYLDHLINDDLSINLILNVGDYDSSLFDIQGNDVSRFSNGVFYIRPTLKGIYQINDKSRLNAGVEVNMFDVRPGEIAPEGEQSTVIPDRLDDESAIAISPFVQYELDVNQSLSLSLGLRYTTYSRQGPGEVAIYEPGTPRTQNSILSIQTFAEGENIVTYTSLEPRLSLRQTLGDDGSLKFSFNRSFQYLNQISNTSSSTPIDIWQLSDFHIRPQEAFNFSLGYFKNFNDGQVQTSIQGFYRRQPEIIEYKDFADLLLNDFIEQELVTGEGQAFGVELNYTKDTERTNWQVNYTYSRSLRRVLETPEQAAINEGDWFPSNFDRPPSLNFRMSQRVGKISELSVNFTYSTGRPLTVPVSNFRVDNIRNIPIFSDRNEFRIPDYHRLDVSYTIGPFGNSQKRLESTLIFSVFNLYGRDNAFSVFFRQQPSASIEAFRIATLGAAFPSITYNFSF